VRFAALRHLSGSGLDVAKTGPVVGGLRIGDDDLVVADSEGAVRVIDASALRDTVAGVGRWCVFDPGPVRRRIKEHLAPRTTGSVTPFRDTRSA
jgi:hypothetical protein